MHAQDQHLRHLTAIPDAANKSILGRYQELSKATINHDLAERVQIMNFCFGLIGEFGELTDHLKKHHFQGHGIQLDKLIEEAGDLCWYAISLLTYFGIDAGALRPGIIEPTAATIEGLIFNAHRVIGNIVAFIASEDRNQTFSDLERMALTDAVSTLFQYILAIVQNYNQHYTLADILQANVTKLQRRYIGAFSVERSANRTAQALG